MTETAIEKVRRDLVCEKYGDDGGLREFRDNDEIIDFVRDFLQDRDFPGCLLPSKPNAYLFRLSPDKDLEVRTYDSRVAYTILSVEVKEGAAR